MDGYFHHRGPSHQAESQSSSVTRADKYSIIFFSFFRCFSSLVLSHLFRRLGPKASESLGEASGFERIKQQETLIIGGVSGIWHVIQIFMCDYVCGGLTIAVPIISCDKATIDNSKDDQARVPNNLNP